MPWTRVATDMRWREFGPGGGDYDRFWAKFRGEGIADDAIESVEVQALWSLKLDPWFNLQTGVRYDIGQNLTVHI